MKIIVFRKTWTLTCKLRVKVTFFMKTWNDPTVITVILPQPVSHKPIIKVEFLTEVSISIFSKVWASVWGLYSTIWRNSCGNFHENSIRTRLKRSREHRNSKNHEFIIYSSSFGGRRQRRQPVINPNPNPLPTLCAEHVLSQMWASLTSPPHPTLYAPVGWHLMEACRGLVFCH